MATTQISLIREHTMAINPPRALWVPFILGRPFGVPGDAAFQTRVLTAALRLLEVEAGPVLVDYPEDAPAAPDNAAGVACPVSFAGAPGIGHDAALLREVDELQTWHDRAVERRGHSMVGLSKMPPQDAARVLLQYIGGDTGTSIDGLNAGETIKLVCEDLRTYYYEAAAARPSMPDADTIQNWFWRDTACGQAFLELHRICVASKDASLLKLSATSLVPRAVLLDIG